LTFDVKKLESLGCPVMKTAWSYGS